VEVDMYAMTRRGPRKPSWKVLYLLATLLIGAVGLVEVGLPPGPWGRALEFVVCVVGFGAMHLWVRANRCALELLGERDAGWRRETRRRGDPESLIRLGMVDAFGKNDAFKTSTGLLLTDSLRGTR
jgi:hypothetical protein